MNHVSLDEVSIVANCHRPFSRILREDSFSDLMEYMTHRAIVAKVIEKADA